MTFSANDIMGFGMFLSEMNAFGIDEIEQDDLEAFDDLGEAIVESVNAHAFLEALVANGDKTEWAVQVSVSTAEQAEEVLGKLIEDDDFMWGQFAEDVLEALQETE